MNISRLQEAQSEFARLDLGKIKAVFEDLSHDRIKSLEFAGDPDAYMFKALSDSYIPPGLHFHLQIDGENLPNDIRIPEHQFTFSSNIDFDIQFKSEVIKAAKKRGDGSKVKPYWCDTCEKCVIAVVR